MSTHNLCLPTSTQSLCFEAKITKNVYHCKPLELYYIKVGCKGVFVKRVCFRDEMWVCHGAGEGGGRKTHVFTNIHMYNVNNPNFPIWF